MHLIGSMAAQRNGVARKTPVDIDLVCSPHEYEQFLKQNDVVAASESPKYPGKYTVRIAGIKHKIEIDATDNASNGLIADTKPSGKYILGNTVCDIANVNVCYLTKRSHANYPVNFEKTFGDLVHLAPKCSEFTEAEMAYYRVRRDEAKNRFSHLQKKINLNKKNEDFFMGGSDLRTYDHDWLHAVVAYKPGHPMYEKCKNDLALAKIERGLFENLDLREKLTMVQEEAMVIGLERFYIPGRVKSPKIVYREGLLKLTRDLCKGWFQDFILDNASLLTEPMWEFVDRFEREKELKIEVNTH